MRVLQVFQSYKKSVKWKYISKISKTEDNAKFNHCTTTKVTFSFLYEAHEANDLTEALMKPAVQ